MAKKAVNLKHVAEEAGVSNCTASKALRGDPKISEATRKKVEEAAEKLGYRPDPEINKFMSYVSRRRSGQARAAIGLLTPYKSAVDASRHNFYQAFLKAVVTRASDHGYHIDVLYMNEEGMRPERLSRIIRARGLDGVIVSPTGNIEEELLIKIRGIPVVSCLQTYRKPVMNRVEPDFYRNTRLAVDKVFEYGYRRPLLALFGGYHEMSASQCEAAFLQAVCRRDPEQKPVTYLESRYDFSGLEAAMQASGADCILSNSLLTFNWLYEKKQTEGFPCLQLNLIPEAGPGLLRIPIQIQEISGVDTRSEAIDCATVDLLVGMILRNERDVPDYPQVTSIQGVWHEGKTLPSRS